MFLRQFVRAQVWTSGRPHRLLEDRGATAVEYALMLAFIFMVIFAAVAFLGSADQRAVRARVEVDRFPGAADLASAHRPHAAASARLRLP